MIVIEKFWSKAMRIREAVSLKIRQGSSCILVSTITITSCILYGIHVVKSSHELPFFAFYRVSISEMKLWTH